MIQAVQTGVVKGDEADEFLNISLSEAKRLQKMVQDLLELQTLEAGTVDLEKEPVDLKVLITGVIMQLKSIEQFDGIELNPDLPDEEIIILGDPGRLRQILLNLMITARCRATQVRIHLFQSPEEQQVIMDVEDNGKGIE